MATIELEYGYILNEGVYYRHDKELGYVVSSETEYKTQVTRNESTQEWTETNDLKFTKDLDIHTINFNSDASQGITSSTKYGLEYPSDLSYGHEYLFIKVDEFSGSEKFYFKMIDLNKLIYISKARDDMYDKLHAHILETYQVDELRKEWSFNGNVGYSRLGKLDNYIVKVNFNMDNQITSVKYIELPKQTKSSTSSWK